MKPVSRDIFGAEVQYFRLNPRHWAAILDRLAGAGLRGVTTCVCWGVHRGDKGQSLR
jgi:beta-galactosidase GanA